MRRVQAHRAARMLGLIAECREDHDDNPARAAYDDAREKLRRC